MTSASGRGIGVRLRFAREAAGLSQGQVAKKLGLHRPAISELEAGRRRVSSAELTSLAEIYGVDLVWLTSSEVVAPAQARVDLVARHLARLSQNDLEQLLALFQALKTRDMAP